MDQRPWLKYMTEAKLALENGNNQLAIQQAGFAVDSIGIELNHTSDSERREFLEKMLEVNDDLINNALGVTKDVPETQIDSDTKSNSEAYKPSIQSDSKYKNQFQPNREIPDKTYDNVAGLESFKKRLYRKAVKPFLKRNQPTKFNLIGKGSGVVLYGPPGCGKSLLAMAAAGEAAKQIEDKLYFISPGQSDTMNMWHSNSEQNIRAIFEEAAANTPCYLFFDEVEALIPKPNALDNIYDKIVAEFKSDFSIIENKAVFVIAATNYPWQLDATAIRHGRFGSQLYVPPPDLEARAGIFLKILENEPVSDDVEVYALAELTKGYASVDLKAICEEAEDLADEAGRQDVVCMEDFLNAKQELNSSLGPWAAQTIAQANQIIGTPYTPLLEEAIRIQMILSPNDNFYGEQRIDNQIAELGGEMYGA